MRLSFVSIALWTFSLWTNAAMAQEVAGLREARDVAACVHRGELEIHRLMVLIDQAEQRARQRGVAEDVRRDAIASIETLIERIRSRAQEARRCLEQTQIPVRIDGVQVESGARDPAHDSLAADHGTVHQVEQGTPLGTDVVAVRGERVDGDGSAPDESVRAAMRGIGTRLSQCYGQYLDRSSRQVAEIHLSFTANDGGRISRATVEQAGGFDAPMRQCVERAAQTMTIAGQRGRAVYAYTLRFGSN